MYSAGIGAAIGILIIALALPAVWFVWWRMTDSRGFE